MPGAALIIIDMQKAIDHPRWGERNNPEAEQRVADLLVYWRKNAWPIIHIRHDSTEEQSPYRQGQPLHDFKVEALPIEGEPIIGKSTANAFAGTLLDETLQGLGIEQVVICGVLTQHSVDTSARMAAALGYQVTIVSDATAAVATTDITGRYWKANEVHTLALTHFFADYGFVKTSAQLMI